MSQYLVVWACQIQGRQYSYGARLRDKGALCQRIVNCGIGWPRRWQTTFTGQEVQCQRWMQNIVIQIVTLSLMQHRGNRNSILEDNSFIIIWLLLQCVIQMDSFCQNEDFSSNSGKVLDAADV